MHFVDFRVPILATTAQAALEKTGCEDSTCDDAVSMDECGIDWVQAGKEGGIVVVFDWRSLSI